MVHEEVYNRQTLIEGWDQSALGDSSVLIAGVGALGCEVAKNLAMMGIGTLVLIDNDSVELSNTSRQMLFSDRDIGLSKVHVAARKLKNLNPRLETEVHDCRMEEVSDSVYSKADLFIGGLDNWPSRRFLNSVSIELEKPYIDGGTYGMWGNVQLVIPFHGACLECYGSILGPEEDIEAECTLRRRKPEDLLKDLKQQKFQNAKLQTVEAFFEAGFKTINDLKYAKVEELLAVKGVDKEVAQQLHEQLKPKIPACLTINALIGGVQSHEALKILMHGKIGSPINNYLQYDGVTGRFTCLELIRNEDCIVCGENFRLKGVEFRFDKSETVLDLKNRLAETLGYPDMQLQYQAMILSDELVLGTVGIAEGESLFVHSRRLYRPLKLIARTR